VTRRPRGPKRFMLGEPPILGMLYFSWNQTLGPEGLRPARFRSSLQFDLVGAWLSLVEHLVRDQGVGGSNPLAPTNLCLGLQIQLFCPLRLL
jgi:hypothetical protein